MSSKNTDEQLTQKIAHLETELDRCKRTEIRLREKDMHLKAMVEAFDGLIYVCSQDYRVEFINEQYIKRIGFDPTGQVCYKALHNRDAICPWCLNERIFNGETVRCEVVSHRNRWYHVVSTPIYHSDGSISKHAMIIEVTDRKKAEQSLKKKVEEQELLLDNIQIQIWYLSDVKTYGAVNQAHADFLGLKKKDIEARTLPEVLGWEKADVFIRLNKEVFEKKTQIRSEEWIVNGDGQRRLLWIIKTPKLDKDGNVEYVVCSGEDITDYRRTEESLRRSKKRLDLAMEATSDALWDWDLTSDKAYFNPSYYTMLGFEPYELAQSFKTWKSLLHPDDKPMAMKKLEEYVQKKVGSFEVESRMKTKQGGWRWIMARGKVAEKDDNGTPVRMVGTHVDITERKLNEEALRKSAAHLQEENLRLRSTLKSSNRFGNIIGKSKKMQDVYEIILKSALSGANVIIYGESGTGKELVAKTIHDLSKRAGRAFVTVNCGAIPGTLLESEFFGYKKGAFTGANIDKPGYLDMADRGTLFMDEVGELDLNMQVKLLRAIEGGGYTPIGSRMIKKPDIRIIAATNRDLKECVKNGQMREDFYYRIHVIPIHLPPLKDRKEDISLLIHHFLETYNDGNTIPAIEEDIMKSMQQYDWPGNVRELQNAIHRYVTLKEVDFMNIEVNTPRPNLPKFEEPSPGQFNGAKLKDAMDQFEKKYIKKVLADNQWHRSNAAKALGINRKTLFKKIKAHGL